MTLETYIRAQLARVSIEHGARYGGINNMLGVAMVLRNRVFKGWGTWLDVVETAKSGNEDLAPDTSGVLKTNTGRILLNRIDEIYSRPQIEDLTGDALFWVNPQLPIATSFKEQIMQRPKEHPRCAHIGPVWFYQ